MGTKLDELYEQYANLAELYTPQLLRGGEVAKELFEMFNDSLEEELSRAQDDPQYWASLIHESKENLKQWKDRSGGKKQNYTPGELAIAKEKVKLAQIFCEKKKGLLKAADLLHENIVSNGLVTSGLLKKMIEEGRKGTKLGVVELSSRIGPVLTPPGSSAYLEIVTLPYGRDARKSFGEEELEGWSYVSADVAGESADNLVRTYRVKMALAETSAAPEFRVKKSGKKPTVFIHSIANGKTSGVKFEADTIFRDEFNAFVREKMFKQLCQMYGIC